MNSTVSPSSTAFFGMSAIKQHYVNRAHFHRNADEIAQGMYVGTQEDGRPGYCAVGCLVHDGDHSLFEKEMGVSRVIARLADCIFEGLPEPDFKAFPVQFIEAIPVGADLSLVAAHFMVWLLADADNGVIRFANEQGKAAIEKVAALYERRIASDEPTEQEWESAARAAARAAYAAADAAARAAYAAADAAARAADAAARAAYAAADAARAAYAAADAAAYAADAAARAAYAAARAAYQQMRDKFLELLASAPVLEMSH